jgi:CheY-like chemotaxis protein
VLVCDDAPGVRLVMGAALADLGLEPIGPAETWEEAIALAAGEQPDAILADLWMPTYEPSRLAALRQASPKSLIFVLSVFPVDQAREAVAGVAEVAGIYSKPDPPQLVASRVRDALAANGVTP